MMNGKIMELKMKVFSDKNPLAIII